MVHRESSCNSSCGKSKRHVLDLLNHFYPTIVLIFESDPSLGSRTYPIV